MDDNQTEGVTDNTDTPADDTQTTDDQQQDTSQDDNADADAAKADGEGDTQTGDQSDGDGKGESAGAPDEYEAFNLPDGMDIDQSALDAATPLFKEMDISQQDAQKLVDVFVQAQEAQSEAISEQFRQTQEEWAGACKNHAEYGGDKYDGTVANIHKLYDLVFGDKPRDPGTNASDDVVEAYLNHPNIQFRAMLTQSGLGNNPQLFELLATISKHVGEAGFDLGSPPPKGSEKDRAELMYPNAKS